jgi:DNA-binding transcriptional regulator YdaS (Cro superfamily)
MRRPWLLACCLWAAPLLACSGGLRAAGHADGSAGTDGPVVPADLAPVEVATSDGPVVPADLAPVEVATVEVATSDGPVLPADLAPIEVATSDGPVVPADLAPIEVATSDGPVVPADLAPVVVATIVRRGTNYGQLAVVVYSDASTVRALQPMAGNGLDASAGPDLPPGSAAVVKLLQDLALVEDVSAIQGPPTCVGDSVSFGTRTYLTVGDKTGGNLQCPDNPTPAQAALAADCVDLTQ